MFAWSTTKTKIKKNKTSKFSIIFFNFLKGKRLFNKKIFLKIPKENLDIFMRSKINSNYVLKPKPDVNLKSGFNTV
jgi:hypothetical protein